MLVVDVETTGLNPWTSSLLSVAAVSFEHPQKFFYVECRADSRAEITAEALRVNGFTLEQINDPSKPSSAECVKSFLEWVARIGCVDHGVVLAGHNPAFDSYCLLAVCQRSGFKFPFQHRTVDLHSVYHALYAKEHGHLPDPSVPFKLDYILERVGLPARSGVHSALTDVRLEAEALSRLLYGKILFSEFEKFPIGKIFL